MYLPEVAAWMIDESAAEGAVELLKALQVSLVADPHLIISGLPDSGVHRYFALI
jgi:hypothetical protein